MSRKKSRCAPLKSWVSCLVIEGIPIYWISLSIANRVEKIRNIHQQKLIQRNYFIFHYLSWMMTQHSPVWSVWDSQNSHGKVSSRKVKPFDGSYVKPRSLRSSMGDCRVWPFTGFVKVPLLNSQPESNHLPKTSDYWLKVSFGGDVLWLI